MWCVLVFETECINGTDHSRIYKANNAYDCRMFIRNTMTHYQSADYLNDMMDAYVISESGDDLKMSFENKALTALKAVYVPDKIINTGRVFIYYLTYGEPVITDVKTESLVTELVNSHGNDVNKDDVIDLVDAEIGEKYCFVEFSNGDMIFGNDIQIEQLDPTSRYDITEVEYE